MRTTHRSREWRKSDDEVEASAQRMHYRRTHRHEAAKRRDEAAERVDEANAS